MADDSIGWAPISAIALAVAQSPDISIEPVARLKYRNL
jgi:hypothetical protein